MTLPVWLGLLAAVASEPVVDLPALPHATRVVSYAPARLAVFVPGEAPPPPPARRRWLEPMGIAVTMSGTTIATMAAVIIADASTQPFNPGAPEGSGYTILMFCGVLAGSGVLTGLGLLSWETGKTAREGASVQVAPVLRGDGAGIAVAARW